MQDFSTFITQERERLNGLRDDALTRKQQIDQELSQINQELVAIEAYEAAKVGKPKPRTTGTRRTGQRQAVLEVIKQHPDGISPSGIRDALDLNDKSGSQSVSNALSALRKKSLIVQENGLYTVAQSA